MVLGNVVSDVVRSRAPIDDELALADAVADPVKTHVNGLGSLLFDLTVGKADGSLVINLDGGWRLEVTQFLESDADGTGSARVEIGSADLGFHGRTHDGDNDLAQNVDWAIGGWM